MVLFDRSWYNRSNVEWVMGFCTEDEHEEFLRSCPEFERMLVRSGIVLVKYWFSVSFEEQRRRFEARNAEPLKRWKLTEMDLAEHELYVKYSMAKDTTFQYTDIKQAPWSVVPSDDKKAARLNCITHLLSPVRLRGRRAPRGASCRRCGRSPTCGRRCTSRRSSRRSTDDGEVTHR